MVNEIGSGATSARWHERGLSTTSTTPANCPQQPGGQKNVEFNRDYFIVDRHFEAYKPVGVGGMATAGPSLWGREGYAAE